MSLKRENTQAPEWRLCTVSTPQGLASVLPCDPLTQDPPQPQRSVNVANVSVGVNEFMEPLGHLWLTCVRFNRIVYSDSNDVRIIWGLWGFSLRL